MKVRTDNFHETCPLYDKRDGQVSLEPAFIHLDCRGGGELYAYSDSSLCGTPVEVHHKLALRWRVDATVLGSALLDLFEDVVFLSCCQRIIDGFEEDSVRGNDSGKFTDDALEAIDEIATMVDALSDEVAELWDVEEWLFDSSTLADHWPDGVELDEVVKELDRDAETSLEPNQVVIGSIKNALLERALEDFHEAPESLYETHVEALLKEGRITENEAQEWGA